MSGNSFLEKAIPIVNKAAEEDAAGNYDEAYKSYQSALEMFMLALKYEKNPSLKESIKRKMVEYMDRAEKLKQYLSKGTGGAKGTSAKRSDDEDDDSKKDDDDAKKLKGALAGAILTEKPNVHWEDIAGLDAAKAALKEAVILPIKFPNLFTGKRTPWRGILLFGPPGTGKTYLAKAVATECDSTFLSVSSSDLVSKWMGESERLVKQLFSIAREKKPAIIFVDEIDSLCGARGEGESEASRRIKTEFLVQMQGVGNDTTGILVLAATNTPWALDPALRRRFERRIYIPLPDQEARKVMFKIHIGSTPCDLSEADMDKMALMTEGMSGSDISSVVRDALFEPVRKVQYATHFKHVMVPSRKDPTQILEHVMPCAPSDHDAFEMTWTEIPLDQPLAVPDVTFRDFIWALNKTKKSVGKEDVERQLHWMTEFGQEG